MVCDLVPLMKRGWEVVGGEGGKVCGRVGVMGRRQRFEMFKKEKKERQKEGCMEG